MLGITDSIKNYVIIGLLAALALGGFAHWVQTSYLKASLAEERKKVAELEADVTSLTNHLETATTANKAMAGTIMKQNTYIATLVADEQRRRSASAAALAKAQADGAKWRTLYDGLLSAGPVSSNLCESADDKLNKYIQVRKGEKQ